MKNKVIAWIILAAIASAWIIWTSYANFWNFDIEERQEIRAIAEKVKAWETLTTEEQTRFDEVKNQFWDRPFGKDKFSKKWSMFIKSLTDEEKTALESMTDEEKQAFFEQKKAERYAEMEAKKAQREAEANVIDKLLAWEILTAEEETIRTEILAKREERKQIRDLMEKSRNWETLTTEEQAKLDEFKANMPNKGEMWKRSWHDM